MHFLNSLRSFKLLEFDGSKVASLAINKGGFTA